MVPRKPHLGSISTFNYLKPIMFNSSTHFLKKTNKENYNLPTTYNQLLFGKLTARKIISAQLCFPLTKDTVAWRKHYCDRNYCKKRAVYLGICFQIILLTPEFPQFQNLDSPPNDDLSVCEGILNPPPEPTWTKQVA